MQSTNSKYSVILKTASPISEIECSDLVYTHDKAGNIYLNFIDTDGRWWIGGVNDFIIINNNPSIEELEHFEQLKISARKKEELDFMEYVTNKRKVAHDVQFV